jgi:hypothetical protein
MLRIEGNSNLMKQLASASEHCQWQAKLLAWGTVIWRYPTFYIDLFPIGGGRILSAPTAEILK